MSLELRSEDFEGHGDQQYSDHTGEDLHTAESAPSVPGAPEEAVSTLPLHH